MILLLPLLFSADALFVEVGDRALPDVTTTCGSLEKDYILEVNGGGVLLEDFDRMAPAVTHPTIIDHPVNGRRCLYVSSGFVVGFEGMDPEASRALLDDVVEHMQQERFILTSTWRMDQVVLWDNRQLNHCAGDKHTGDHSASYRIGVYDDLAFYTTQPAGRLYR